MQQAYVCNSLLCFVTSISKLQRVIGCLIWLYRHVLLIAVDAMCFLLPLVVWLVVQIFDYDFQSTVCCLLSPFCRPPSVLLNPFTGLNPRDFINAISHHIPGGPKDQTLASFFCPPQGRRLLGSTGAADCQSGTSCRSAPCS